MAVLAFRINGNKILPTGCSMSRISGAVFAAFIMIAAFSGLAGAEITLPVNDNNTGVFDQPSVAMDGSTARIAYIGGSGPSGPFTVYYAAVSGGKDFANLLLVKDNTVMLTSPVAVDNTGTGGNSSYYDARHPKIALRSSTEAVILFQAKPTDLDTVYRLYIARFTLAGNTATLASVKQVTGFPSGDLATGDIEDISFAIVATDNSARIAFANRTVIGSDPFQVYFARIGIDNSLVVGTPILLSSLTGTNGLRPLPSLGLDSLNRSHVAWAANNASSGPSPVFYAMIKETNGIDNRVISATQVIGSGFRWGFPSTHVFSSTSIAVLAADETTPGQAGNIGFVNFNPDGDNQDGSPVVVASNTSFFITPPGELILPDEFSLYHPGSFLDSSGRFHMTGYGVGGTRCIYFAFHMISTFPYYEMLTPPAQVGFDSQEYPREISGDYTQGAFGYISTKAIVFWSGLIPGGTNRNLDVTTAATITLPVPFKESGCSMVSDPGVGEGGRMAGTAFLFLPAIVLAIRRISRGSRSARRSAVED